MCNVLFRKSNILCYRSCDRFLQDSLGTQTRVVDSSQTKLQADTVTKATVGSWITHIFWYHFWSLCGFQKAQLRRGASIRKEHPDWGFKATRRRSSGWACFCIEICGSTRDVESPCSFKSLFAFVEHSDSRKPRPKACGLPLALQRKLMG